MYGLLAALASAVLFYLVGYAAVNLGGFGVIAALARRGREPVTLEDFQGLAVRRPGLAAAVSVFLISLTGVPISAGFVGKFYLFSAAVAGGYTHLAIIGMLMSAVSAYYYLRVIVTMYMRDPESEPAPIDHATAGNLGLVLSVLGVLLLGLFPDRILELLRISAGSLF